MTKRPVRPRRTTKITLVQSPEQPGMVSTGFSFDILYGRENAGFIRYIFRGEEAHIAWFVLKPMFKGRGIESLVYSNLEKRIKSKGIKSIKIDITRDLAGRTGPLGFWKNKGFREISHDTETTTLSKEL